VSFIEWMHERRVAPRRVRVLAERIAALLPADAHVLDVGCGDGRITRGIGALRPDLRLEGLDVAVRPNASVPVRAFDGETIPAEAGSFDAVVLIDVLHHARDAQRLLGEAARVASRTLVIKDHLLEGCWAERTLRFMDRVGNRRHGVALDGEYWNHATWQRTFRALDLEVKSWTTRLGLYPAPWDRLFERSLHFVASLDAASPRAR